MIDIYIIDVVENLSNYDKGKKRVQIRFHKNLCTIVSERPLLLATFGDVGKPRLLIKLTSILTWYLLTKTATGLSQQIQDFRPTHSNRNAECSTLWVHISNDAIIWIVFSNMVIVEMAKNICLCFLSFWIKPVEVLLTFISERSDKFQMFFSSSQFFQSTN